VSAPFRYTRRVQFAETDQAGIVHFSWYFRYMEEAEHALWRAAGLSIAAPDRPVVFPRVSATCDFLAPLRFEDEFHVDVRILSMSRRSIRYACTMGCGETTVARGSLTVACAAGTPLRGAEIPEDVSAGLRAVAPEAEAAAGPGDAGA
jgi:acyl-CoA thioester hydrolase